MKNQNRTKRFLRYLTFPFALAFLSSVFMLIFILILLIITLTSIGMLSAAVSFCCIVGILTNVATDLAPPAMLLAGVFCIFTALSLFMALFRTAPKSIRLFHRVWDWFRLYTTV